MPCTNPLQAQRGFDGKIHISRAVKSFFEVDGLSIGDIKSKFSEMNALYPKHSSKFLSLPCGQCIHCRLARSREWAVRCVHEASLHPVNSFVTLTFDNPSLSKMCPNRSLDRSHVQKFLKRLRSRDTYNREKLGLPSRKIRYYSCGEYGGKTARPHYHLLLFNCDFPDRLLYKTWKSFKYYNSSELSSLWPYGFSVVADVSFQSSAYVARYCTKKINRSSSSDHYGDRIPEFGQASTKPGIGAEWFYKFTSDLYPSDTCIIKNDKKTVKIKPPRYYDKLLERSDSALYDVVKSKRDNFSLDRYDDVVFSRLNDMNKCYSRVMDRLIRKVEDGLV